MVYLERTVNYCYFCWLLAAGCWLLAASACSLLARLLSSVLSLATRNALVACDPCDLLACVCFDFYSKKEGARRHQTNKQALAGYRYGTCL